MGSFGLDLMARLGWTTVKTICAKCGKELPYGTAPCYCHSCYYGYGKPA